MLLYVAYCFTMLRYVGVSGKRGAGIRTCGARGPGDERWKTRGLVKNTGFTWKRRVLSANHGGIIISLNNAVEILFVSNYNENQARFLVIKANKTPGKKKNYSNANMFCMGRLFYSVTCVEFFSFEKEIMK